jgi:hypothetical protein
MGHRCSAAFQREGHVHPTPISSVMLSETPLIVVLLDAVERNSLLELPEVRAYGSNSRVRYGVMHGGGMLRCAQDDTSRERSIKSGRVPVAPFLPAVGRTRSVHHFTRAQRGYAWAHRAEFALLWCSSCHESKSQNPEIQKSDNPFQARNNVYSPHRKVA